MRYLATVLFIIQLAACNINQSDIDRSVTQEHLHGYLIDHMMDRIANYEMIYAGQADSVFLTVDEEWEFLFFYVNIAAKDTLEWNYNQLKINSTKADFASQYLFVKKEQRLVNTKYYGMGYKFEHIYRDTLSNDTFKVEVRMDTNMNVKRITSID